MKTCEFWLACSECITGTDPDCFRCHGRGNVCGCPAIETEIGWFCKKHLSIQLGDKTMNQAISKKDLLQLVEI